MEITPARQYRPAFGVKVVHNKALRILIKDAKKLYGEKYIQLGRKQLLKLGTPNDTIKFTYSTWDYKRGIHGELQKEGITFALLNDKHIGHFENRFFSNFIKTANEKLKIIKKTPITEYKKHKDSLLIKKEIQPQKPTSFWGKVKKFLFD